MADRLVPEFDIDGVLDGNLTLRQPRGGEHVAIDALLLAAAVAARSGERILDVGTGSGAVALCLAHRLPGVAVTGNRLRLRLDRTRGRQRRGQRSCGRGFVSPY